MIRTAVLAATLSFLLASCVKAPEFPIQPAIEFVSAPTGLVKHGDSLVIVFAFTDGDGDIGVRPSADTTPCACCRISSEDSAVLKNTSFNIFLIDNRDLCVKTFASGNILNLGRNKSVEGEIVVIASADTKKCVDPPEVGCPLDTVVYSIILRDIAGHYSNLINTSPILIDGTP